MQINPVKSVSNINFKGHEARKLDALVVQGRSKDSDVIFQQLNNIAMQHKLKVVKAPKNAPLWIQDYVMVGPDKKAWGYLSSFDELSKQCGFQQIDKSSILNYWGETSEGGNIFYVTDKDGKNVLIYSKDEKKNSLIGLEDKFNVDRIIELPKADYHTDLFLTPIGDNKILVANDNLMIVEMYKMIEKISNYISKNPNDKDIDKLNEISINLNKLILNFKESKERYTHNGADEEVAQILEKEGFEVIKVPSRLYRCDEGLPSSLIRRKLNYSNAVTFKNEKNQVVYIVGKSAIDDEIGITDNISKKLDIGFERAFRMSISSHIKPENTYFINGSDENPLSSMLFKLCGGLHCMCVEVPSKE